MTVSFDANVLVYATAPRQGEKAARAQALIERGMQEPSSVLLLQALSEFSAVALRKFAIPVAIVRSAIDDWRAVLDVHAAVETDLYDAYDAVHAHHLAFWDALLWATARRIGVHCLLTEDFQDGRVLGGVRFVNPFARTNDRLIDELMS